MSVKFWMRCDCSYTSAFIENRVLWFIAFRGNLVISNLHTATENSESSTTKTMWGPTFRLSLRAEYSTQIMYDAIMIAGTHTPAMVDTPRKSRWYSPSSITARAIPPATYLPVRRWSSWRQKYHMRILNECFATGIIRSFCISRSNESCTDRYFYPPWRVSLLGKTIDYANIAIFQAWLVLRIE